MRRQTSCLILALLVAMPCFGEECGKEWVFHFPQPAQKGQVLTIADETLADAQNIRPGYKDWLEAVRVPLLASGFAGKQASQLTIYRDCKNQAIVEMEAPAGEEREQNLGQQGQYANSYALAPASKKRRFFSFLLRAAPTMVLSALTFGASTPALIGSGVMAFGQNGNILVGHGRGAVPAAPAQSADTRREEPVSASRRNPLLRRDPRISCTGVGSCSMKLD